MTRHSWGLRKWLFAGQITVSVQGYVTYWLLALVVGTTATGVFAACMSVALLSNPLILGGGNLLTPKLALAWKEGSGERLRRESIQDAMWLGAGMVLFCVAALLVGDVVMHFLYPNTDYAGQGHTVTVLMVAMLVMAVGMPAYNALTSMEHPRVIFWTALWAAVVTGSLVWWLVVTWGLVGAAYGILAGNVVRSTARWIAFLSLVARTGTRANPGRIGATPISAEALSVLQQLAPGCKTNDWVIEQLAEGVEANIYRVRCSDHHLPVWQDYRSVAIKLYKPWLSPDIKLVRRQFESLSCLYAALDGSTINGWKISIPAPLYICESPLALVTSMVTGTLGLLAESSWTFMNWEDITGARTCARYLTGEDMLDAYWKAFLGGHTVRKDDEGWAEERARWEQLVQEYREPCKYQLHRSKFTYGVALGLSLVTKSVMGAFGIYGSHQWPADLRSPKASHTMNRRMFTTRDGYIGLGPKELHPGDRIALLSGGRLPFVLRPDGSAYQLIGDCYIHGMMSGERYDAGKCSIIRLV